MGRANTNTTLSRIVEKEVRTRGNDAPKMKRGRRRRTMIENELEKLNARRHALTEALGNQPVDPEWKMAFIAAQALHTLERGTPYQKSLYRDVIQLLRKTKPARLIDPNWKLKNADFLGRLIEKCAPGWPWRQQVGDQRVRDTRIAEGFAQIRRQEKARVNRFATPDSPDAGGLNSLRQRISHPYPVTWPTLRELKLATAIPERGLTSIIIKLRAQRGEIIQARDPFKRFGPPSNRYGPRLVIGVLKEFLRRLPTLAIDGEERQRLRSIAKRFIHSLGQKQRYVSSTV
jgi:hypothetical protein